MSAAELVTATPESAAARRHSNPKDNNFNVLRFLAASFVIVSHGIELPSGIKEHDLVHALTGKALSWYAVNLFFVISGYLIFVSWRRNPSLIAFCWARFLRLMPGLFVMLAVTVPILGAAFSYLPLPEFLTNSQTIKYVLGCLSILFVKYDLPGVFASNPVQAVNGSLWTLRYEVCCYAMVALAGVVGLWRQWHVRLAVLPLAIIAASVLQVSFDLFWPDLRDNDIRFGMLYELARLGMCFMLGGLYADLDGRLPLRFAGVAGLFLLLLAVSRTSLFMPVANVFVAYAAMWLAFVPDGRWLRWTRSSPDYSYGIYIYAFPVQQALIALMPGISTAGAIIGGFLVTLPFAGLSWHLIEKPALALKLSRRRDPASDAPSAAT